MKRKSIWLFAFIYFTCNTFLLKAQQEHSEYLFKDFTEALVYYHDGRKFIVDINYNFIDKQFVFYDRIETKVIKTFEDVKKVAIIKMNDRTFRITPKGRAEEIIRPEPFFSVEYIGRTKEKGKNSGYGGRSETTAIQSYTGFHSNGMIQSLERERLVLMDIDKTYRIILNDKEKTFARASQFVKLFPHQKEAIDGYIQTNATNFDDISQVILLYDFSLSLP